MYELPKFYIDGRWVDPKGRATIEVVNPTTEQSIGRVAISTAADVDQAALAARKAFDRFSRTTTRERSELLGAIIEEYRKRMPELCEVLSEEMGAPAWLSQGAQVPAGLMQMTIAREVLDKFAFEERRGETLIVREAVGVCALMVLSV